MRFPLEFCGRLFDSKMGSKVFDADSESEFPMFLIVFEFFTILGFFSHEEVDGQFGQ